MAMEMKARPTEYKGIRFRSKSEAVFARCLDLSTGIDRWSYEPQFGVHPWDFCLTWFQGRCGPCAVREVFVECKPIAPTATYISELITKTRTFFEDCLLDPQQPISEGYVVFGSPAWNGGEYHAIPIYSRTCQIFGWGDFDPDKDPSWASQGSFYHAPSDLFGITSQVIQEAATYRFDLDIEHKQRERIREEHHKAIRAIPDSTWDGMTHEEQTFALQNIVEQQRAKQGIPFSGNN